MLEVTFWSWEGGRRESGEFGLAGKIQFLREETGSEQAIKAIVEKEEITFWMNVFTT